MHVLVVLNDGETYSDLEGCSIIVVDDAAMELIEQTGELRGAPVLVEMMLADVTERLRDATV